MMPRGETCIRVSTLRIAGIEALGPEQRTLIIVKAPKLGPRIDDVGARIKKGEVSLHDPHHRFSDGLTPDRLLVQLLHVAAMPGEIHESPVLDMGIPMRGHHPAGCHRVGLPEDGVVWVITFHLMPTLPGRPVISIPVISIQVHPAVVPHLQKAIWCPVMRKTVAQAILVGLLVTLIASQIADPDQEAHEISLVGKI